MDSKISLPLLGSENWSIWKEKFEALLTFKNLDHAIWKPDSDEGKKANGQARALMTLYMEDGLVKLIRGEKSAALAWKKLEDTFQKNSNARIIQIRKKMTMLKKKEDQSIVEYLASARELQFELETTGQIVSDMEIAVHALNGLPPEYATLVEVIESGDSNLTLDSIQPRLMQREEKMKLQDLKLEERNEMLADLPPEDKASAFSVRNARSYSDNRTCWCCGETGHVKFNCRRKNEKCENCGLFGHLTQVCRKGERGMSAFSQTPPERNDPVAFTAWIDKESNNSAWFVDSGSTEHLTGNRSQFSKFKSLSTKKRIQGIGNAILEATGIGEVELHCPNTNRKIVLQQVLYVPKMNENLFALRKAVEAGAEVTFTGTRCEVRLKNSVILEAGLKNGLWRIENEVIPLASVRYSKVIDKCKSEKKSCETKTRTVEVDLWKDDNNFLSWKETKPDKVVREESVDENPEQEDKGLDEKVEHIAEDVVEEQSGEKIPGFEDGEEDFKMRRSLRVRRSTLQPDVWVTPRSKTSRSKIK